jgi:hypothetical protein
MTGNKSDGEVNDEDVEDGCKNLASSLRCDPEARLDIPAF